MAKDKKSLNEKIATFVRYNWWSMSLLYMFGTIFMIYSYYTIQDNIDITNQLIKKHIQSVVLLTPDGRAVSVVRTKIDPDTDAFKVMIKRVLVDYLIIDYAGATNGFKKKIVRSEDELYKNSEKLRYFRENYLAETKKAMNLFKSYVTYLLSAINRDELPDHITPWASRVIEYKNLPNGRFSIEIQVDFELSAYYVEYDERKEKEGTTTITAKGNFDLEKATANNPMGLKFDFIQMEKIEKRQEGEKIKQ